MSRITRRDFLGTSAALAASVPLARIFAAPARREALPVAGVVTEYRPNSHAEVILGKILEGYDQKGGPGPDLKLVALYTDQVPKSDTSRAMAEKHGFRITKTIDEALTLGTDKLQVAGVLSIGEHGDYPITPDTKQTAYPRRRFFDEIAAAFKRVGKVVPVFNDKHLSYRWADAKHMYDTAVEMKIPFMAGSSVPLGWRTPPLALPMGCEVEAAMGVGYGGLEAYGFHTIEGLQCMIERRKGGETGVAAIRALGGEEIAKGLERGDWSEELLKAALAVSPGSPVLDLKKLTHPAFYQIEYRDGLKATVAMANGVAREFAFAARLKGEKDPVATWYQLDEERPYAHFALLLRGIEHMIHTGKPAYPVERTLLSTGILDVALHSLAEGGKRHETPELNVKYQPADWPFARK